LSAIPLIFTSGWASGINCYAVVLMLGMLGRFGHMSAVPPTLLRADVLAVAGVLFACQFLVGKVPYLDAIWDLLHTAVRPVVGGAIGLLMVHHAQGSLTKAAVVVVIGGGTSLITHLVKTGVRLSLNTSPEPVSNSVVSVLEDLAVAGMVVFALLYPIPAAVLAAVLLLMGIVIVALLAGGIGRAWRSLSNRRQGRLGRGKGIVTAKAGGPQVSLADRSEAAGGYFHSPYGYGRGSSDDWL
jgi:uncharacterized protein DUF4126